MEGQSEDAIVGRTMLFGKYLLAASGKEQCYILAYVLFEDVSDIPHIHRFVIDGEDGISGKQSHLLSEKIR